MMEPVRTERGGRLAELTVLDWIGLVVVVPAVMFLLAAPLVVTPAFAEIRRRRRWGRRRRWRRRQRRL
jgi:hypothetical protein